MHITGPESAGKLVRAEQAIADLDEALRRINLKSVDAITFSGTR